MRILALSIITFVFLLEGNPVLASVQAPGDKSKVGPSDHPPHDHHDPDHIKYLRTSVRKKLTRKTNRF